MGRRLFLGGLAGAAAISPWMRASRVLAGGGTAPKRLVIWHTPAGSVETAFRPTPGATESDFTLNSILAPLEPFRDRLLVFGATDIADPAAAGYPTNAGYWRQRRGISIKTGNAMHTLATMLTGSEVMATDPPWASSVSVDQLVAQRLGDATPFRSLELAAQDQWAGSGPHSRMCYAGPGLAMPPEQNPRATFDRLFGGLSLTPDPAIERARRRRRSLLDFGTGELARARAALGTEEQRYLDSHAESIRELERRLDAMPAGACVLPTAPDPDLGRFPIAYNVRPPEFVRAQADIAASAFACDLTRVASFSFGRSDSHMLMPHLPGLAATLSHHDLSHTNAAFAVPGAIADPDGRGAEKLAAFAAVNRWYMEELAHFMGRLDEMPEGDGTVLDHTLIVGVSEHSEGNYHTQENMPFFFAGGASGYFRMGRYVQYADKPHNDMLLSICHAMGLEDVTTFGNPDVCTGPLPGLT